MGAQQVVREFLEQYERLSDKRTFIDVTGEARKSIKVQLRFLWLLFDVDREQSKKKSKNNDY